MILNARMLAGESPALVIMLFPQDWQRFNQLRIE
jgi:hypothetical protein